MKNKIYITALIILGFALRIALVSYGNNGDVRDFAQWGQSFWALGASKFYFSANWPRTPPVYPPIASLLFASIYWLYDHRYVLAQIHNSVRIIPSFFIVYFYDKGYYLLLKLPVMLADLGVGLLIYKIILTVSSNWKKAFLGLIIYFLNPITIFLSGVWGQGESIISFLGILSFILLVNKKFSLSIPIYFLSLYFKPTWAIFIPFYLFIIYCLKPKFRQIVIGIFISFGIFLITSLPFANGNLLNFTEKVLYPNFFPGAKGTLMASNSVFNFWTIFFRIDRDPATTKFLLIPANYWSLLAYFFVNVLSFSFFKKSGNKIIGLMAGLFVIGFGSFLFLTGMLERYFFASLPPLIILTVVRPKLTLYLILINIILFLNLFWSFYRRGSDELDHPFTNYNFLFIRVLSIVNVMGYLSMLKYLHGRNS